MRPEHYKSKKERKAWRIALNHTRVLCKTHDMQKVTGYESPGILVLECGCKRTVKGDK